VLRLVDVARRRFDPEAAEAAERSRADGRKVWVSEEMTDGTRTVVIEADALDVTAFDSTLSQIADSLAVLGDPDVQDVRRAKAVGIIADPQGTLDLYDTALRADAADAAETDAATTGDTDTDCVGDSAGEPGPTESTDRTRGADTDTGRLRAGGRARAVRPRIQLHVHLTAAAIKAGTGVARVEELGPATLVLVERWLGRSDITLKPVIDLDDRTSVDGYETPASMRETVLLRNPCCPFPWCTNLTRRKDMDHIVDYVPPENGGPPGQTAPHLLGPLCRRHHRYKTTGGWHYSMPEPGIYLWRSPQGRHYLVDHTGTENLDATG